MSVVLRVHFCLRKDFQNKAFCFSSGFFVFALCAS